MTPDRSRNPRHGSGAMDQAASDGRKGMAERDEPSLPASLVSGRLEGFSVPDLLWSLCGRRATGVLQLTSRGLTKKVYIDSGRIVFALSDDPNDRLGALLLRDGVITLDQLEQAILQLSSGKRLGTILVGHRHLTPDNLVRGVLSQVKGIVLALFPWEEGEYAFVQGPLPTDEVVTLGMRTAEILLQGIRQIRSFSRIRKSVGPPSTRFRLDPGWRSVLDGLDIRDGERMLLQGLDEAGERGASVDAMCREVFLSNYEIYQALWAFRVLGIVEEVDRRRDPALGVAIEGRLERVSLPEVLIRLCRDEATGVLYVARGMVERTLHINAGMCVFATSNAIDDGLVAHLLRRGVISLADREETARRLLSNKRVGTILLEMGVIDEADLRATVREQLSEIVFDTFRWDEGDFQFRAGDLPTVEEITLNRTVEDLVFAGIRRVTSWSRVREGCGGLAARLVLLPQYLAVLDNLSVGSEEWELISLLKNPKTVLEVCRESMIGDFRSCQILWALRLIGGIGEAPIEVSVDTALGLHPAAPPEQPAIEATVTDVAVEVTGNETPSAPPEHDAEPIPVSEADDTAEVISEPWRLAAERPPEDSPAATTPAFRLDSPADATLILSREDVEAALRDPEPDDGPPRFELGEPGTGLEDMNVDMRPAVDAPTAVEMHDFDRTTRVSREEIESALIGPADAPVAADEPVPEPAEVPGFEPSPDLEGVIASFNARHVVLFRALRAEVGAGAANFVRSCRATLDNGFAALFATAELRADGSWDPEGLKRCVIEHRIENVPDGFRTLLDDELERLKIHLGERRAAALADQLAAIL